MTLPRFARTYLAAIAGRRAKRRQSSIAGTKICTTAPTAHSGTQRQAPEHTCLPLSLWQIGTRRRGKSAVVRKKWGEFRHHQIHVRPRGARARILAAAIDARSTLVLHGGPTTSATRGGRTHGWPVPPYHESIKWLAPIDRQFVGVFSCVRNEITIEILVRLCGTPVSSAGIMYRRCTSFAARDNGPARVGGALSGVSAPQDAPRELRGIHCRRRTAGSLPKYSLEMGYRHGSIATTLTTVAPGAG